MKKKTPPPTPSVEDPDCGGFPAQPASDMEPLNKSGITFLSWAKQEIGHVLEGIFAGTERGKYDNDNFVVMVNDAPVKFTASAGLRSLEEVKLGARVRIEHLGMMAGKNGREYRSFNIMVEKGGRRDKQGAVS